MLHTFASLPRHALWLALALVVGIILALFAGYVGLLVWVMVAG